MSVNIPLSAGACDPKDPSDDHPNQDELMTFNDSESWKKFHNDSQVDPVGAQIVSFEEAERQNVLFSIKQPSDLHLTLMEYNDLDLCYLFWTLSLLKSYSSN